MYADVLHSKSVNDDENYRQDFFLRSELTLLSPGLKARLRSIKNIKVDSDETFSSMHSTKMEVKCFFNFNIYRIFPKTSPEYELIETKKSSCVLRYFCHLTSVYSFRSCVAIQQH